MDARDTCPQIELACGDTSPPWCCATWSPLSDADKQQPARLCRQAMACNGGSSPGSGHGAFAGRSRGALGVRAARLWHHHAVSATDFTQVNPHINRVLVSRALRLLEVQSHERVIDWFCGLGNFTLPLAPRRARGAGH